MLVTPVGADAHSCIFYFRVKGELENAARAEKPGVWILETVALRREGGG